ncbi:UNKNOWN [Stylonychia lemnae]|uniref:Uncharacterized protein n=1 Tax=Stylonychia lemnae TaxID=5949 RepID=A0A078A6D3_STYLE|nr:UNKNOWN [Stylonychia lemnae]|eukprot:CDW77759.1 UNKNOWN [Stylonychia lemnae]
MPIAVNTNTLQSYNHQIDQNHRNPLLITNKNADQEVSLQYETINNLDQTEIVEIKPNQSTGRVQLKSYKGTHRDDMIEEDKEFRIHQEQMLSFHQKHIDGWRSNKKSEREIKDEVEKELKKKIKLKYKNLIEQNEVYQAIIKEKMRIIEHQKDHQIMDLQKQLQKELRENNHIQQSLISHKNELEKL